MQRSQRNRDFPETKGALAGYLVSFAFKTGATFSKGDPDVQPEPEPWPTEPESRPETRPAGRRPKARPAAAGPEPSGQQARSAGPGWSLVRTQSLSESREGPAERRDFSFRCRPGVIDASCRRMPGPMVHRMPVVRVLANASFMD